MRSYETKHLRYSNHNSQESKDNPRFFRFPLPCAGYFSHLPEFVKGSLCLVVFFNFAHSTNN